MLIISQGMNGIYHGQFLPLDRPEGLGAFSGSDDDLYSSFDLNPEIIAKVSII